MNISVFALPSACCQRDGGLVWLINSKQEQKNRRKAFPDCATMRSSTYSPTTRRFFFQWKWRRHKFYSGLWCRGLGANVAIMYWQCMSSCLCTALSFVHLSSLPLLFKFLTPIQSSSDFPHYRHFSCKFLNSEGSHVKRAASITTLLHLPTLQPLHFADLWTLFSCSLHTNSFASLLINI